MMVSCERFPIEHICIYLSYLQVGSPIRTLYQNSVEFKADFLNVGFDVLTEIVMMWPSSGMQRRLVRM
jgi:hypothetical protein